MIVLCSDGLSSHNLISELQPFLSQKHTAALVVTADHIYKENNYHVPRCISELESLGLTVSLFDIDIQDPGELVPYDVVEFIGGNPYYLLDSIRKHNAQRILKEIAETKVLIGWSAASFVFGPTLKLVDRYTPEMNFLKMADLSGLSLTKVEVLPHYQKFTQKFEHFEEICAGYEQQNQTNVIRLNDGDGVLLWKGRILICRASQ